MAESIAQRARRREQRHRDIEQGVDLQGGTACQEPGRRGLGDDYRRKF